MIKQYVVRTIGGFCCLRRHALRIESALRETDESRHLRAVENKLNRERSYPMCKWSPAAAADRPAPSMCFHLLMCVVYLLESFRLFFFALAARRSLSPLGLLSHPTRRSFSSLSLATFFRSVCVALDRELRSLPHSPKSNQRMSARPGEKKKSTWRSRSGLAMERLLVVWNVGRTTLCCSELDFR